MERKSYKEENDKDKIPKKDSKGILKELKGLDGHDITVNVIETLDLSDFQHESPKSTHRSPKSKHVSSKDILLKSPKPHKKKYHKTHWDKDRPPTSKSR